MTHFCIDAVYPAGQAGRRIAYESHISQRQRRRRFIEPCHGILPLYVMEITSRPAILAA